jgi:hypothetical protein
MLRETNTSKHSSSSSAAAAAAAGGAAGAAVLQCVCSAGCSYRRKYVLRAELHEGRCWKQLTSLRCCHAYAAAMRTAMLQRLIMWGLVSTVNLCSLASQWQEFEAAEHVEVVLHV